MDIPENLRETVETAIGREKASEKAASLEKVIAEKDKVATLEKVIAEEKAGSSEKNSAGDILGKEEKVSGEKPK